MQSPTKTLWAVLVVVTALGCPRAGGNIREGDSTPQDTGRPKFTPKSDSQADAALAEAERAAQGRSKVQAAESYLTVRKSFPESIAGQEALYRAGVLYFEAGDYVSARKHLNQLLYENPLFDKGQDARLKLGLASVEVRAYRDAYQTLSSVADRSSGADRQQALEGASRAAEGAQLYADSLRIALKLLEDAKGPEAQAEAMARVTELVESKVAFIDLVKVREGLAASNPAWPLITFKLGRVYYHLRDWVKLEEMLQAFLREAPSHGLAPQVKELLGRANRRSDAKPKTVGLLLPMTGKYKQLGEAVMRGVNLALQKSNLELVVKDTQGDVVLAGKMAEELVFDDGAMVIIGPLMNEDSRRAALVAEELQVPIITLTRAEGITELGSNVFRNMLTYSQQAKALADYAVQTLGYTSFGVLYPNRPYGVEMAYEFWDRVAAHGGVMRAAEQYDHDQTTYTTEAKKLVGRYYLDERGEYVEQMREINASEMDAFRKRKAMEKLRSSLEPVVDFEALFIPDSWERVSLVAPALAVEDIITNACDPRDLERIRKSTGKKQLKTVTLLGPSTWSSPKGRTGLPELIERGGKFVTCAVFVDGFFADSTRPATRRFVNAYKDHYKEFQPTLLDAIGYDTAMMVKQVIEKGRAKTRDDIKVQLSTLKNFDGATGKTSFDEKREAAKPLFLLTVESDGLKEIPPSEKSEKTKKPSGS